MATREGQERAMRERDERIAESWRRHGADDDISTPRLLQMVADDTGCDTDRVIRGLVRVGILEPTK